MEKVNSPYYWNKELKPSTDVFETDAQVLVNFVSADGTMEYGLPRKFRNNFPNMHLQYKTLCAYGRAKLGYCFLYHNTVNQWVATIIIKEKSFDTPEDKYIIEGIRNLLADLRKHNFVSVAIPYIYKSNWEKIRPLIIKEFYGTGLNLWVDRKLYLFKNRENMKDLRFDKNKTIQTCKYCGKPMSKSFIRYTEGSAIAVCKECFFKALSLLNKSTDKAAWRNEPITEKQMSFIKGVQGTWKVFNGTTRGEAYDYISEFLEHEKQQKEDELWEEEAIFDSLNRGWGDQI